MSFPYDDFSNAGYVVGNPINGTGFGSGWSSNWIDLTNNWRISSTGPLPGSFTKVVRQIGSGNQQIFRGQTGNTGTGGIRYYTMEMLKTSMGSGFFYFQLDGAGNNIQVAMNGNGFGGNAQSFNLATTGGGVTSTTGTLSANTWYTVQLEVNQGAATCRIRYKLSSDPVSGYGAWSATRPLSGNSYSLSQINYNNSSTGDAFGGIYFNSLTDDPQNEITTGLSAYENFDTYTNGNALNTLNGGGGWNAAWSTGSAYSITNTQFETSPNSLLIPNAFSAEATRDFAAVGSPFTSDVSVKFWVRLATTSSEFTLRIRDATFIQNFGISFQNTTMDVVGITPGGITPAFSGVTWVPNTWYEVIMKYNRTTGQYSWQVDNSSITTVTGATGRNYFRLSTLADDGLAGVFLDTIDIYTLLVANNPVISGSSANSLMFSGGI